ncbi:FAD binding domain-containing protein [Colletotrichum salicis]|uniref:FAD binding domain-containing protein n=1 Tax=Colletotrichum salicis TaxID=1209931 RepID=A0A135UFG6_9PEZI|nr:FAD binding domain-containing protein [Colletotrichum salicis]
MHALYLLLTSFVTAAAASEVSCAEKAPKVCQGLRRDFGNSKLLPEDEAYTEEVQESGLKRIVDHKVEFAMRGGGHMPISNASSIGATGILVSSKNTRTLQLSDDRDTLTIGPGLRWSDVYTALDGTGVTVLGGRGSPTGVSGLLLGGGVSIFSYEYGLASTNGNIKAYEVCETPRTPNSDLKQLTEKNQCVLADGSIAQVTSTNEHADLFWALQVGGNSFCLVTRFHLQTRRTPSVMIASPSPLFCPSSPTSAFKETRGGIIGFAFNPIISAFLAATNARPGALQGIDESPACWIEQTYSWADEADDEIFNTFISEFNARVRERLEPMGALYPFYYLNEANVGQPVFKSYPEGNLDRLKEIRNKYDPARVLTDLTPGGFKVATA